MSTPHYAQALRQLQTSLQGSPLVTIGNFDGVHLGHRGIFAQTTAQAAQLGTWSVALTFEPHPVTFFGRREASTFRLTSPAHKDELIRDAGMDLPVALPFDLDLAAMSPEAFVEEVLHQGLRARSVRVGHDFNFGKNRTGGVEELRHHAQARGITLTIHDPVTHEGAVVSSTRVRKALAAAELAQANTLLGRPHALRGQVSRGDGRGRKIGFPTANIHPEAGMMARHGVYITRLTLLDAPTRPGYPGITNLGARPTIADALEPNVETLILDGLPVDTDLYGQNIQVELLAFVRDERKFDSLEQLRAQIALDVALARQHHGL